MAKKNAKAPSRYYTHAHNVDTCLENGSFVRVDQDGAIVQYINGDYMGELNAVPGSMTEVLPGRAFALMPKCCPRI